MFVNDFEDTIARQRLLDFQKSVDLYNTDDDRPDLGCIKIIDTIWADDIFYCLTKSIQMAALLTLAYDLGNETGWRNGLQEGLSSG